MMIRVGVVGYGYWGPNLVRNFMETPGSEVVAVSDQKIEQLASVAKRYPTLSVTREYRELLTNPRIDAIAIATPVSSHFQIAMEALKAGKSVLVEKPMTADSEQALRLMEEADRRNLVVMVDHTFVYTGAVRKIHDMIESGTIGQIYYFDSVRVNLGLFQHDVNVLWDLAVHDLAIMDYVLPSRPHAVSATGISHVKDQPENIGYITLFHDDSLISHIHVNWLSPVKIRRTLIGGSREMIVYDDLEPSEKLKVYNKGITLKEDAESVYQMLISYRTGDMRAPHVDTTEALRTEALHFIHCIEKGEAPLTSAKAGCRSVRILEAATLSMRGNGRTIELDVKEI
jgi:predicted dehydrogenase